MMDSAILRQKQTDRGGRRPVTFYLGYLPPGNTRKMGSGRLRNSTGMDISNLNPSAMLSCWEKVHGAHQVQSRKSENLDTMIVNEDSQQVLRPVSVRKKVNFKDIPMGKDSEGVVGKPKVLATRQSSYPGLRRKTLIQNEAKRLSMPLPVLYEKEVTQRHMQEMEKSSVKAEAVTDVVRNTVS